MRDLNAAYRAEPALWVMDFDPTGFWWLEPSAAEDNVVAFARRNRAGDRVIAFVANLSPVPREDYVIGLPRPGRWRELVNTDANAYGGSDVGNQGSVVADGPGYSGQPHSAKVTLPPLAALWLVP